MSMPGNLPPGARRVDPDAEAARLIQERADLCVVPGGHCWERTGIALTSAPPQYPEKCRHCPATRVAVAQEPFRYERWPA